MKYFDLHCDTLCACYEGRRSFWGGGLHVDLNAAKAFDTYIQCCAAWIPDKYRGDAAFGYFKALRGCLDDNLSCTTAGALKRLNGAGGIGLIPTVEGGSVLGGSLRRIEELAQLGVKMLTLTWNADNEIGGGIGGEDLGLTAFGRQAIPLLEETGILVDVSHAGTRLFEDLCKVSAKPFVASHSNAKAVCGHRRNLSDGQIREIIARGGLIGINFFTEFLSDDPGCASVDSIACHVEHFLSLGAQDVLAMGSDFDGADLPPDIAGLCSVPEIRRRLSRCGYSQELLDKIFYKNAYNFMIKNLA